MATAAGAAMIAPQTTIADVVALARGAAVMVSGDTGPTHIAAAVGTPIVGIYGPTRPERNGPWLPDDETRVARGDLPVPSPAAVHGSTAMCLLDIEVDEVLAAVERRLRGAQNVGRALTLTAPPRATAGSARIRLRRSWCSGSRSRRGQSLAVGQR